MRASWSRVKGFCLALSIRTNIAVLEAQRELTKSSGNLSTSFQKLSSGLRINSPSDDPAGLAVAAALNTDARLYTQAIRNINDGVSLLHVAEGALSQLNALTTRQLELAEQATNGTLSHSQRLAINQEANALVDEFNRIVESTDFNGKNLLDGSIDIVTLQVGKGGNPAQGNTIDLEFADELQRISGDGTFKTAVTYDAGLHPKSVSTADVNSDGIQDLISASYEDGKVAVFYGKGDGTFNSAVSFAGGDGAYAAYAADLNNDGRQDLVTVSFLDWQMNVLLATGAGTFSPLVSYSAPGPLSLTLADLDSDGDIDVATSGGGAGVGAAVFINKGDGTFNAAVCYIGGNDPCTIIAADINGDGILDLANASASDNTVNVLLGNGNGTFKAPFVNDGGDNAKGLAAGDFNSDGYLDLVSTGWHETSVNVLMGNGDGTFKAKVVYEAGTAPRSVVATDLNGDGYTDLAVTSNTGGTLDIFLNAGDGTFGQRTSTLIYGDDIATLAAADFNGDGVQDIAIAVSEGDQIATLIGNSRSVSTMAHVDLLSESSALLAMTAIQETLDGVNMQSGIIGGMQRRLSFAADDLFLKREYSAAALSRIVDADVAEETANLVSNTIRQQTASAILAHAISSTKLVLRLLE